MSATRAVTAGAALIAGACAVAGCSLVSRPGGLVATASRTTGGASVTAAVYQSPEQATLSWFFAVNHKDKAAAVAHFEPAAAGQMNWGNGNTSTWATFTALHCKQVSRTATDRLGPLHLQRIAGTLSRQHQTASGPSTCTGSPTGDG